MYIIWLQVFINHSYIYKSEARAWYLCTTMCGNTLIIRQEVMFWAGVKMLYSEEIAYILK